MTVNKLSERESNEAASDWFDYRKEYQVSIDPYILDRERKAFLTGWINGYRHHRLGV